MKSSCMEGFGMAMTSFLLFFSLTASANQIADQAPLITSEELMIDHEYLASSLPRFYTRVQAKFTTPTRTGGLRASTLITSQTLAWGMIAQFLMVVYIPAPGLNEWFCVGWIDYSDDLEQYGFIVEPHLYADWQIAGVFDEVDYSRRAPGCTVDLALEWVDYYTWEAVTYVWVNIINSDGINVGEGYWSREVIARVTFTVGQLAAFQLVSESVDAYNILDGRWSKLTYLNAETDIWTSWQDYTTAQDYPYTVSVFREGDLRARQQGGLTRQPSEPTLGGSAGGPSPRRK